MRRNFFVFPQIVFLLLFLHISFRQNTLYGENQVFLSNPSMHLLASIPDALTLNQCLSIAASKNWMILRGKARTKAQDSKKDQVLASQFPTGSFLSQDTKFSETTFPTFGSRQDVHRISFTDSFQPFGRFSAQRKAAQNALTAAQEDQIWMEIDVAFQVTKNFFDVILAQELIKVASESIDQLSVHRNITEALVQAGAAPKFDLLRAEVQLSSAKPALIRAKHARANSTADLMNLLGLDPTATPVVIGSFPENLPEVPSEEKAFQIAQGKRGDFRSLRAAKESSRQSLNVARQGFQPSVQLSATWEKNRGIRPPIDSYRSIFTTQAAFVFPFLDSGLTQAKIREASANFEHSSLVVDSMLSTIKVEIRKALSGLFEANEVLRSQEKNVEQAQEALSIAEIAYKTGAKTSLDVLDAQVALTQARTLRFQALHGRVIAFAQLQRTLGLRPNGFQ